MSRDIRLHNSILLAVMFVGLLWLIKAVEAIFGFNLLHWGVYPRSVANLPGILFAPFIHSSLQHLAANTPPLILLGAALLYGSPKARWWTLAIIWVVSGVGVWVFARQSYHLGASGLTHGIFFFLFFTGILRRDKRSIALLMIAFFMYGGMLLSVFPTAPDISFETHGFGALGGIISAILFRHWDRQPERRYSWELESTDEEDSGIGDEWKSKGENDER